MGIKPTYIKAIGLELFQHHSQKFSNNFEENKQAVADATSIGSKRVRNRIAGYITRKVNTRRGA